MPKRPRASELRRLVLGFGLLSALGIEGHPQQGPGDPARAQALAATQSSAAQSALILYLNTISNAQLERRAATVASITTKEAAERRQAEVRRTIGDLVGGVPRATGPVTLKRFGAFDGDGFRVENIAYESLPGDWVTANVCRPTTRRTGSTRFGARAATSSSSAARVATATWVPSCRKSWDFSPGT